jgi:biotin-dependent carboxylase-like uncharacterized protein
MSGAIRIIRAGPLTSLQDGGRAGGRGLGISASGPMDRRGYALAGHALGRAGITAIEFTRAGLEIAAEGQPVRIGFAGGTFIARKGGSELGWPGAVTLEPGENLAITPGAAGNYGYLRFDRELQVAPVMGSRSTNVVVGIGGWHGRCLAAGDELALAGEPFPAPEPVEQNEDGPIRVLWGLHADLFEEELRQRFLATDFAISPRLDRMGVRLNDPSGVFRHAAVLSLVSDSIVPGDIQILGDGTPIVLMRDHQPTGGYPRIATVIAADFDRFAQLRSGTAVRFAPVSLDHAQALSMRSRR